jgi:hypothetical protein
LKEFEQHLHREQLQAGPIKARMRRARQFVQLLIGRPHEEKEFGEFRSRVILEAFGLR